MQSVESDPGIQRLEQDLPFPSPKRVADRRHHDRPEKDPGIGRPYRGEELLTVDLQQEQQQKGEAKADLERQLDMTVVLTLVPHHVLEQQNRVVVVQVHVPAR